MADILLENYLASQFTFGFELEAFYDPSKDEEYDSHLNKTDNLNNLMFRTFNDTHPDIHGDGSLNNIDDDLEDFEYASKVYHFTPKDLKEVIEGLDSLFKDKMITTNTTCGFHTHISFPDIEDEDAAWIVLKLAENDDMLEKIRKFKGLNFFDEEYANFGVLKQIGYLARQGMWRDVKRKLLTTDKYRVLRIHPQGTLEWRGPRNFMNRYAKSRIYAFFKLLYDFISFMSKALASKEAYGTSKENIFKILYGDNPKDSSLISNFKGEKVKKFEKQGGKQFVEKNNVKGFLKLKEAAPSLFTRFVHILASEYEIESSKFLGNVLKELMKQNRNEEVIDLYDDIFTYGSMNQTLSASSFTFDERMNLIKILINKPHQNKEHWCALLIDRFLQGFVNDYNSKELPLIFSKIFNYVENNFDEESKKLIKDVIKSWFSKYPFQFCRVANIITDTAYINNSTLVSHTLSFLSEMVRDIDRFHPTNENLNGIIYDYVKQGFQSRFIQYLYKAARENEIFSSIFNNMIDNIKGYFKSTEENKFKYIELILKYCEEVSYDL